MKYYQIILLLVIITLLESCAATYMPINPNEYNYLSFKEKENVKLEYKYDILKRKQRKKEIKKSLKLVSIKITNNTERDLVLGRDIKLTYENGNAIQLLSKEEIYGKLKQHPAVYILYMLLTPLKLIVNNNNYVESIPAGLVVAPLLTGANIIMVSSSNKEFKSNISKYQIEGMTIAKGQSLAGLIGISSKNYEAITFQLTP